VGLTVPLETPEMENFNEHTGASRLIETASTELPSAPSGHRIPCNDATSRVRPISAEEQAAKARATVAFVDLMLAMRDEDPSGAWEVSVAKLIDVQSAIPEQDC
jgi:hypothetical protein